MADIDGTNGTGGADVIRLFNGFAVGYGLSGNDRLYGAHGPA